MTQVDWKRFGVGLALACGLAAAQYGQALPEPYGPLATMLAIIVAHFSKSWKKQPAASAVCASCGGAAESKEIH